MDAKLPYLQKLEHLFNEHYRPLCYLTLKLTGDPEHATEIVTLVFKELAECLNTFNDEQQAVKWLYAETGKTCHQFLLKQYDPANDDWPYELLIKTQLLDILYPNIKDKPNKRVEIAKLLYPKSKLFKP